MVGILRKSKCLVDLRSNFTIRKAELALVRSVISSGLLGVLFPEARDLPPL